MVKTNNKGFTLVELMIVIAIIGVLAAALFPMMRGYLEKSRDTARISHLGQLRTVVQSYLQDIGATPQLGSGTSWPYCAGDSAQAGNDIAANLNGGKVPVDPVAGRVSLPCGNLLAAGNKGLYGYATGTTAASNLAFFIVAHVEASASATTGSTVFETGTIVWTNAIDALLQVNGQKGIANSTNPSASGNYSVYVIGGMN